MITSFERLLAAIDELEDPAWCEGVARIAGPPTIESDGDTCTNDRGLVPWLLERSQDAPFGDGKATRLDTAVRATKRLRSRGTTVIIYNGMFSGSGYFGNECGDAYVYAIAALELALDPYAQRIS